MLEIYVVKEYRVKYGRHEAGDAVMVFPDGTEWVWSSIERAHKDLRNKGYSNKLTEKLSDPVIHSYSVFVKAF